jgi:dihydrodipicolinate synthase/N-acetylneuraminate lyase
MFSDELKDQIRNVHAYAVTPFSDDLLSLDLDGYTRNIEFMLDRGVKVVVVGGGTGEVNSLTVDELETMARHALKVVGDRGLVIPALPDNLGAAAELAPRYEKLGVRIALGMAPFIRNLIPDDLEGVFNYYQVLGGLSDMALMPYNTQGWTGEFFARLAENDKIIGVKDPCQHPHNLFRAIQLVGDRFVWIGNKRHDPGVLHLRFQMGIEAFTAGFTNFAPEFELKLFEAAQRKDWDRMVEIQAQIGPLEQLRNRHAEGIIKSALDLVGLKGGKVRPPRMDASAAGVAELREELRRLGVAGIDH